MVRETPLRVAFGLAFVLFVPGYAFVAALFPEAGSSPKSDDEGRSVDSSGITGIERVALSFGLSIAVVPLIGLVLNFTPWGLRLVPILVSVGGFTAIATVTAAVRRRSVPPEDRFAVPYREWWETMRAELFQPATRTDAVLNVALVCALLLATSSVAYAVAAPNQGAAFSEFYLLTENDEGDRVANDYPTEFVAGQPQSLVVGIGNHEHEPTQYTVIAQLQRVERTQTANGSGNGTNTTISVQERQRLDTFHTQLAANETWHHKHQVSPEMTGEDLRLVYLLYTGTPPATPTEDNAYRSTHLWITVNGSATGTGTGSEVADVGETEALAG